MSLVVLVFPIAWCLSCILLLQAALDRCPPCWDGLHSHPLPAVRGPSDVLCAGWRELWSHLGSGGAQSGAR